MALTPGLRIGAAAGALGLLGVLEVVAGILGSNHQPVLPGLVALALAVAVWHPIGLTAIQQTADYT
jgi:hypothetical protein